MAKVEGTQAIRRQQSQSGPIIFVSAVTLLWAILLWRSAVPIWLLLATLWLLFNFYLWFVPTWRRNIVDRRGPLLGVGFAFAVSLVSAVTDGLLSGLSSGVMLFFLRWVVLTIPFVLPFAVQRTPYPHPVDLVVLVYALFLPFFPGFSQAWFELPGSLTVTVGILCALGLVATYFYGARTWTAAPLDLKPRPKDTVHAIRTAGYAIAGAVLTGMLSGFLTNPTLGLSQQLQDVANHVYGIGTWEGALTGIVLTLGLAVLVETLVFRGLFQAGIPHWLGDTISKKYPVQVGIGAALLAASVHAGVGVYGFRGATAFGFALGLTWAFRQSRRFFPAVLGQALALLFLATLGLLVR